MSPHFKFPKGFLWGTATSAHQCEGDNRNDWTVWENENKKRIAREAKKRYEEFAENICQVPDWKKIGPAVDDPDNYVSGLASNHYNQYKEDLAIAKKLGHNSYRFSIEWARIEPQKGRFDKREISHYREVIRTIRSLDMEPIVTLWHFTNPTWLTPLGGWESRKTPLHFRRYTDKIVRELGEDVKYWITLNEPTGYAAAAYLTGTFPPEKRSAYTAFGVVGENLITAHKLAYDSIKKKFPKAQVGIAHHAYYFEAYRNKLFNRLIKLYFDFLTSGYIMFTLRKQQDFIGINYYNHNLIDWKPNQNKYEKVSDLGWELYPEGMYHVLKEFSKYRKPMIITENGLADAEDKHRAWFIRGTLKYVKKAISEGIDVRGYLYWTLMDNFEWDKGFWPRFGLIEVDYETQKRKIRESAWEFARLIKEYSNT